MRKFLFVIDRVELKYFEFNNLVTNFWIIRELLRNSVEVFITTIDHLSLKDGLAHARCFKCSTDGENLLYDKNVEDFKVEDFEKVMFRPDPPVDEDYINATYIFDFVDRNKTQIINDTKVIRNFNEKLHSNLFKEFMPENIVTSNKDEIEEFLDLHGEIILKPLNKCFGSGVMYLKKQDKNTLSIINNLTNNQKSVCMVQKYIADSVYGDKRVLILDGEVLDECVMKLPSKDDFKFNTHSDEYFKRAVLSQSEKQKFTQVAQGLKLIGITMAGLDVIDEQIIEINVTSPCFFIKEINNYFNVKLEVKICSYLLEKNIVNACH